MANLKFTPQSFTAADSVLSFRDQVKIGHNTELVRAADGSIYATYHGNRIVHYTTDGVFATYAG